MKLKTLGALGLAALVMLFSPAAHAQTFSIIHTFSCGSDGSYRRAGVTLRNGILYGTAQVGGTGIGFNGNGPATCYIC